MIGVGGYSLKRESDHVYKIQDSTSLSVTEAARLFVGGCPIFAQNRLAGELRFTVVPYAKPADFELATCSLVETSQEELMALVLPSHKEGDLYIKGVKISVAQLAEGKKEMIPSCTLPSSLVIDFADATEIPGRALDLGCGIGANSVVLLNKRWDVIAVDKSPVAVQGCLKTCEGALGSLLSIQADIATMDLPGSMDLIVAVDVLPYMSETEVPSLLSKIHAALHPGGRFIGTLFVCLDGETREISIGRGLGVHYYHGDRAPAALLQHAGFHIERCSLRYDYDDRAEVPQCVEFIATR